MLKPLIIIETSRTVIIVHIRILITGCVVPYYSRLLISMGTAMLLLHYTVAYCGIAVWILPRLLNNYSRSRLQIGYQRQYLNYMSRSHTVGYKNLSV